MEKRSRYQYTVIDSNYGNEERYLDVGKQTSEVIDTYLAEGQNSLKIQRFGSGMETRYHVTPDNTKSFLLFFGKIIYYVGWLIVYASH